MRHPRGERRGATLAHGARRWARAAASPSRTDEEQVRTTLTAFSRATAAKDYQALCDRLLAPSLIADLKKIGLPCEIALQQGLGDVKQPRLIVGDVTVEGKTATAEVENLGGGPGAVVRHGRARAHRGRLADRVADDAVGGRARRPDARLSVESGCASLQVSARLGA